MKLNMKTENEIYGYSERGIFNSIIYYLYFKQPDIIGDFLEKLGVSGFDNNKHTFTFLNEQSFSEFGDNDLTIIAEPKQGKGKTVIFIEGKRGEKFSLESEYGKIKTRKREGITSNLFIQLYFKYLLSKGNDTEVIDDCLNELIGKSNRKIGKNKIVLKARNEFVKNADKFYYVAIMPKQKDNSNTLGSFFKELKLMTDVIDDIRCAFWQDIEEFFSKNEAKNVIDNFEYNKGQIY